MVAQPAAIARTGSARPLLAVRGVTLGWRHERRDVVAAQNLSFDLEPGERLSLLGPSGCGKSTLLKAIAGFVPPAAGSIELDGIAITGPGPDRMPVFQEFDQLLPWRTVRGNVAWPLRASGRVKSRDEARARADDVLARVGLQDFADSFPHTLSGGMKQRVAIARALALQPELLLMDEPFAALDALTRRRLQEELLDLCEDLRLTLIFVTHAIDEAIVVGTRV
ncbi:MAG: putative transporter ATP-binding component, partial [Rhodospirillales bacterium]|nr:putative transporter ATP-binding component [Rhodospirillales bacterium]